MSPLRTASQTPPFGCAMANVHVYILHLGFSFLRGLVAPAEGRRESIHVGLTAASLLPTPPMGATRPLRLRTEKAMWAVYSVIVPNTATEWKA
jgi:hypothetical protein